MKLRMTPSFNGGQDFSPQVSMEELQAWETADRQAKPGMDKVRGRVDFAHRVLSRTSEADTRKMNVRELHSAAWDIYAWVFDVSDRPLEKEAAPQ